MIYDTGWFWDRPDEFDPNRFLDVNRGAVIYYGARVDQPSGFKFPPCLASKPELW